MAIALTAGGDHHLALFFGGGDGQAGHVVRDRIHALLAVSEDHHWQQQPARHITRLQHARSERRKIVRTLASCFEGCHILMVLVATQMALQLQ